MVRRKGLHPFVCFGTACIFVFAGALPAADPTTGTAKNPESKPLDAKSLDASRLKSTIIGPADTMSITVLNCDEISSKPWKVSINGELNLPLVGRIQAGGKTVEQLEQELTQ